MSTKIYIDADACPVKDETVKVARRHGLSIFIVSNGGIRPHQDPLVETVIVPDGPDVADKWIADRASVGDVVVTADIPLAARVIANGAAAFGAAANCAAAACCKRACLPSLYAKPMPDNLTSLV